MNKKVFVIVEGVVRKIYIRGFGSTFWNIWIIKLHLFRRQWLSARLGG